MSFLHVRSGARSERSEKLFSDRTRVWSFGKLLPSVGAMWDMRFRAQYRLVKRGKRGKLERDVMALSVRSRASLCCAGARFSIEGILLPTRLSDHVTRAH